MVYNKLYNVAEDHPDIMQVIPYNPSHEKDLNIIVARDGYTRKSIVMDKSIKQTIDENFDYHNRHLIEKLAIAAAQLFRWGTTSVYWQFFFANSAMDQISAYVNSRNGFIPGISSIKHLTPAIVNKDSVERKYFQEYIFLAGSSQTFLSGGTNDYAKIMKEIGQGKVTTKEKLADLLDRALQLLSTPGNATEIMTRATEYILSRKNGKSQRESLEEAGRVSTPFHHMGKLGGRVGQSFVKSISYFNASLQVLRQSIRTLGTKKGMRNTAFVVAGMLAAGIGSTLYLLDLDEDDPRMQILITSPPEILNKYVFLPAPNGGELWKIRVPDQYNAFASVTNMYLIESAGKTKYSWSEYGQSATAWMPQQMNPFGGTQAMFSWAPQAIKPIGEGLLGVKSWPNVRPIETIYDKSKIPELRYNDYTSPLAIELGELLGASPKVIDHLITGYVGRASKYVSGRMNPLNIDNVWTRALYLNSSRQVQFFYDQRTETQNKIKAYEEGYYPEDEEKLDHLYRKQEVMSEIDYILDELNEVNPEEYPAKFNELKVEFFRQVRVLEDLVYSE